MREKLIQILNEHGPVGDYDFHGREIRKALESMRCENCSHWNHSAISENFALCLHWNGPVNSQDDFFCAHFETKEGV